MIDVTRKPYGCDFEAVWIKGMNMPDSCAHCPLIMNCDDCEGFEVHCVPLGKNIGYKDEVLKDRRRDDCPLGGIHFGRFPLDLQMGAGGGGAAGVREIDV